MNWDRVEGNWNEFKGKVQQQWGKLTNDDLSQVNGKRTELCGRLQQRYGYAKGPSGPRNRYLVEPHAVDFSGTPPFDVIAGNTRA